MRTRAIVIFLEIENENEIVQLRRRFDPLADLVAPHITLVFPFGSNLSTDEIESHIRNSVAATAPFHVRLARITGHEAEYLFLNVKEGNDQLIALHDRLYSGVLRQYLSFQHTFVPHLTVGRLSEKAAWRSAVEETRMLEVSFETVVSEVAVYTIEPNGRRWIEASVQLLAE